jgi:hypothetical protein
LPQDEPSEFNVDAANVITLVHNFIADNLADMFTKALDRDPFTKLRKLVMNIMIMGVKAPVPHARRIAASRGA